MNPVTIADIDNSMTTPCGALVYSRAIDYGDGLYDTSYFCEQLCGNCARNMLLHPDVWLHVPAKSAGFPIAIVATLVTESPDSDIVCDMESPFNPVFILCDGTIMEQTA